MAGITSRQGREEMGAAYYCSISSHILADREITWKEIWDQKNLSNLNCWDRLFAIHAACLVLEVFKERLNVEHRIPDLGE